MESNNQCERCSVNPAQEGKLLCESCETEVNRKLGKMEDKIHHLESQGETQDPNGWVDDWISK